MEFWLISVGVWFWVQLGFFLGLNGGHRLYITGTFSVCCFDDRELASPGHLPSNG